MKLKTKCPNCEAAFEAPSEYLGKRAKCPKCKQSFEVVFDTQPTAFEEIPFDENPGPPPIKAARISENSVNIAPTAKTADSHASVGKEILTKYCRYGVVAIVALLIGYFSGREHLKHQLSNAMTEAIAAMGKGLQQASNDTQSRPLTFQNATKENALSVPRDNADKTSEEKVFNLGETFKNDFLSITLTSASIKKPKLKGFMDQSSEGKEPNLVFDFAITNTNDRKILTVRENMFMPKFHLRDDVDNVIRGVTYGASKVVGALDSSSDLPPGASTTHAEVFTVPPPKTEFLILTVDLEFFGGQGEVKFRIPANRISRE